MLLSIARARAEHNEDSEIKATAKKLVDVIVGQEDNLVYEPKFKALIKTSEYTEYEQSSRGKPLNSKERMAEKENIVEEYGKVPLEIVRKALTSIARVNGYIKAARNAPGEAAAEPKIIKSGKSGGNK